MPDLGTGANLTGKRVNQELRTKTNLLLRSAAMFRYERRVN